MDPKSGERSLLERVFLQTYPAHAGGVGDLSGQAAQIGIPIRAGSPNTGNRRGSGGTSDPPPGVAEPKLVRQPQPHGRT